MKNSVFYVYMFLDPREPGEWEYKGLRFKHRPFYAGKGRDDRINRHFYPDSLSKQNIKNQFLGQISKVGLEVIQVKLYENLPDQESKNIEIDIISHFGRIDLKTGILANMTAGGDGLINFVIRESTREKLKAPRPETRVPEKRSYYIHQYSLDGELVKTWDYLQQIERETDFSSQRVKRAIKRNGEAYGFRWERGESSYNPTPVIPYSCSTPCFQYSLDGEFIQKFDSLIEAKRMLGERASLKGWAFRGGKVDKIRTYRGFQWAYEYKGEKIPPVGPKIYPSLLMEYSPNLDFIIFHPSIVSSGIGYNFIGKLLKDKSLSKRGTFFQYAPKDQDLTDLAAKLSEILFIHKDNLPASYQAIAALNIPELNEIVHPLLAALN